MDLSSAKIGFLLLLRIIEQPFFAVPLRDTLNLNCWLTTILPTASDANGIVLKQHTMSVEDLSLDIACVSCSSPNFDALIDMLYSGDTKRKVVNFVNLLLESDYLRIATESFVSVAAKQCPHNAEYDPDSSWGSFVKDAFGGFGVVDETRDEKAMYFNVAIAVITVCLILLFIIVKWVTKRKNRALMDSLPSEVVFRLRLKEDEEKEKQSELNKTTESMFCSPQLPRHIRLIVPFVILLTIGLVLVGHLGVLSTVNVVGQFAGETFAVSDVLEFSFFSAALRTYNNGGVEVGILLYLFTGVWLIKLCTSMALWFVPPQKLSVSRRGTILLWLDVFAKLSLPDIFMVILAIGAIMVFMGGVDGSFSMEGDFFATKLIVVPGPGFYCIIIGQRITRVASRYLLDCHHVIVKSATHQLEQSEKWIQATGQIDGTWDIDDDEESKVSDRARSCSDKEKFDDEPQPNLDSNLTTEISVSEDSDGAIESGIKCANDNGDESLRRPVTIIFIGLTVVILMIIACVFAPAISIDTKVVWGLLGSGRTFEEAVNEYGMFWIISRILVQARFVLDSVEDYVGLGFLLALVIITSFAVPAMRAISFFRQWVHERERQPKQKVTKPKTRKDASVSFRTKVAVTLRRWFRGGKEEEDNDLLPACRLKAWGDLEVYIVAFVVACWQLGAVAGYAIHLYCYILEKSYDLVVYLGLMEKTSPQCFRVQASSPTFVMIMFMSFFVLLASFLLQAVSQYCKTMDDTASELKGVSPNETKAGKNQGDPSRCRGSEINDTTLKEESTRTSATEMTSAGSF